VHHAEPQPHVPTRHGPARGSRPGLHQLGTRRARGWGTRVPGGVRTRCRQRAAEKGIPAGVGRGHAWLKSWPQTLRASLVARQETRHLPVSTALISRHPPRIGAHIHSLYTDIHREQQYLWEPRRPPGSPQPPGPQSGGGTAPLGPGAGRGRGCGPP